MNDLTFALRQAMRNSGLSLTIVLTLALGIGATVAIFSVVNAVLLRPLPYAEPERLARIYTEFPTFPNGGLRRFSASTSEYFDLRRDTQSWQSIDAWSTRGANLVPVAEPMRVTSAFISGGLLGTLGVAPALGRLITPEDDTPGAALVAVISDGLWRRAFNGDRAVLGRDLLLNGRKHTVIGVMPGEFRFPIGEEDAAEIWVPLQIDPAIPVNDHSVGLLGRLKPGIALPAAQAELDAFVQRQGESGARHHFDPKEHTIVTYGFHDEVVLPVRPALRMLFGAVCFLLLIACVNVANLLLARAEARQREIAIRGALGAGFARLGRQFATEGMLLSLLGAGLGVLFAQGGLLLIKFAGASVIPQALDAGMDARVMVFAASMGLLTGFVFGLAPLVHVIRRNMHGAIKSAAAATTGAASAQRFRHFLIVGQLALALVLRVRD